MMNFAGELVTILLAIAFLLIIHHVDSVAEFLRNALRLNGIANIKILALPLAFSIGNIFNYFALWSVFKKDFPEANAYPIIRTTVQTIAASLCMGVVTYGALNFLVLIFNQGTFWGIFFQGLIAGFFGLMMFVTVLIMLKNEDIFEFGRALRRKFWKADVVIDTVEVETSS